MALRTITPERKRFYHLTYTSKPDTRLKLRIREQCAYAIRTGKLVRQPCEQCGEPKSEAHHDDYSKPLVVRWLCRSCHGATHRKSHCRQGHALTPENRHDRGECRECNALRQRKKRAERLAAFRVVEA